MTANRVVLQLSDLNPDAVLLSNMDDALIGVGYVGHHDPVAVYSKAKIFAKLLNDGLSQEDADEYYVGKFLGQWAGEQTPVILDDLQED